MERLLAFFDVALSNFRIDSKLENVKLHESLPKVKFTSVIIIATSSLGSAMLLGALP